MIRVENVSKSVGAFALRDVSFRVPEGAYGVLMGKTGCGKTTMLEAICGLRPIDAGVIRLAGRDVTAMKPAARNVGYMPQDVALFQTMTVREHFSFALTIRRWSPEEIERRVGELGELLEVSHLLDRRPHGLSGGESQRVALGRALSFRPPILLLDEPLSALDEHTRHSMYGLLKRVQQHTGVTALHVTHSRTEADALADCVFRFNDGKIHRDGWNDLEDETAPATHEEPVG